MKHSNIACTQAEELLVNTIGIIIIGRNEGDRLVDCIRSVKSDDKPVIYVDSASTDNSVSKAEELGAHIVNLDISIPFTAARARNEGFKFLDQHFQDISYVQFTDGDCQVNNEWLQAAIQTLENDTSVAIVCGRRRERFPMKSIYNYICDNEWNTPVGQAKSCGGDFMIRTEAFRQIGGFNSTLIAGEEPELCVRIRKNGLKVLRIDHEMTLHDANITRFSQWWKRSVRAGHAYAEGAWMHGNKPERHKVKEVIRSWIWAGTLPLITLLLTFNNPLWTTLLLAYPLQISRMAIRNRTKHQHNWMISIFTMIGKFPELQGQLTFWFNRSRKSKSVIIEYK